jgi:hypothetical protein
MAASAAAIRVWPAAEGVLTGAAIVGVCWRRPTHCDCRRSSPSPVTNPAAESIESSSTAQSWPQPMADRSRRKLGSFLKTEGGVRPPPEPRPLPVRPAVPLLLAFFRRGI